MGEDSLLLRRFKWVFDVGYVTPYNKLTRDHLRNDHLRNKEQNYETKTVDYRILLAGSDVDVILQCTGRGGVK